MIEIEALDKTFILHTRGGTTLPVLHGLGLTVAAGECVALHGPSGVGKSTLLRCIYANYKAQGGRILVRHGDETVDMARAEPRKILEIRRATVGYVSQFLRVIPRVPTLDIVAEPLKATGVPAEDAQARARELLTRLHIPERLWTVPPATFSGGEQQRVNLARGFVVDYPIMLLDEPTAALDARNRESVVGLINQARDRGTAIVGIFHDQEVRAAVATRVFDIEAEGVAA